MARSKTDGYLTAAEREALTYLTNLRLKGCRECMRVRRSDMFSECGVCFHCTGQMTPELEARIQSERLLVKHLRAKLNRIRARQQKTNPH